MKSEMGELMHESARRQGRKCDDALDACDGHDGRECIEDGAKDVVACGVVSDVGVKTPS